VHPPTTLHIVILLDNFTTRVNFIDFLINFRQNDDNDFLTPYFLPQVVFLDGSKLFFCQEKNIPQKKFSTKILTSLQNFFIHILSSLPTTQVPTIHQNPKRLAN
jgi:hypothetical protein